MSGLRQRSEGPQGHHFVRRQHQPYEPTPSLAPVAPPTPAKRFSIGIPSTVPQMLAYLLVVWFGVALIAGVMAFFSLVMEIAGAAIFLAMTGAVGQQLWVLLRARQRVLTAKNIPVLWGFVRLIAWDPIEGILTLKNKTVDFFDDNLEDGRGGVRFIYSILGEELILRAPLEVQTLRFQDENVLTREFLSVTMRGTMKWRIIDLRKFYLLLSRELRSTTNHNGKETVSKETLPSAPDSEHAIQQLLTAAISWIQVLVEEETRSVVSKASSGLLIADRLSAELLPHTRHDVNNGKAEERTGAADSLAASIHDTVSRRLETYGISVEDVSLQEMKLPDEIMKECLEACKSFYYPTIAKRKAAFVLEELKAQADVIGRDALAAKEVAGVAPAYALSDFLTQYLKSRVPSGNGNAAGSDGLAMLAGLMATQAKQLQDESERPKESGQQN